MGMVAATGQALNIVEGIEAFARVIRVAFGRYALTTDVGIEGLGLNIQTLQRFGAANPLTCHMFSLCMRTRTDNAIIKIDDLR